MTISNNYVPLRQLGNGVTNQFSGNWALLNSSYLAVYFEDAITGIQTPVTTGFTVTFNSSGFMVAFAVAPPSSVYVVIGRNIPDDQQLSYRTAAGFQGTDIETSFDKLTAITQDISNTVIRSLSFPLGSSAVGVLPAPVDGMLLAWQGTGGQVQNAPSVSTISASVTAATSAAASAAGSAASATTSASTASMNAATSTANAAAVSAAAGAIVTITNQWNYSNSTGMSDPGTGGFKLNNVLASATQLAISTLTGDSGNPNLAAYMATWSASTTASNRGYLRVFKSATPNVFAIYAITGNLTANGSWDQIPITYIAGSGSFSNGDAIFIQFSRTGDAGSGGSGSGDFSSNTTISVDSELVLFSGTLGKTGKRATGSGYVKTTNGVYGNVSAVPLTDLAAQAALTVLANASNASGTPTALALGASQLFGANASGTALSPITLGSGMTMTGTTLSASGSLPSGVKGTLGSSTTNIACDFTTYSSYLLELEEVTTQTISTSGNIAFSSDNGSTFGASDARVQIGTTVTTGATLLTGTAQGNSYNHAYIIHQCNTTGNLILYGTVFKVGGGAGVAGSDNTLTAACNLIQISAATTITGGTYHLTPLTKR